MDCSRHQDQRNAVPPSDHDEPYIHTTIVNLSSSDGNPPTYCYEKICPPEVSVVANDDLKLEPPSQQVSRPSICKISINGTIPGDAVFAPAKITSHHVAVTLVTILFGCTDSIVTGRICPPVLPGADRLIWTSWVIL